MRADHKELRKRSEWHQKELHHQVKEKRGPLPILAATSLVPESRLRGGRSQQAMIRGAKQ